MLQLISRLDPIVLADGPVQPTPVMNGPLSGILTTIGGWVAGILLIAGVLGILVGAILLIVGSLAKMPDAKSWGWKVILVSPIAVILGGSAAAIILLSQGMKVTG